METFGKFIAFLIGLVVGPIIQGFVLSKLWLWFIVSTFSVEPLRIVECIGLTFIVGFITAKYTKPEGDDFWETFWGTLVYLVIYSVFILFTGYIVKSFY